MYADCQRTRSYDPKHSKSQLLCLQQRFDPSLTNPGPSEQYVRDCPTVPDSIRQFRQFRQSDSSDSSDRSDNLRKCTHVESGQEHSDSPTVPDSCSDSSDSSTSDSRPTVSDSPTVCPTVPTARAQHHTLSILISLRLRRARASPGTGASGSTRPGSRTRWCGSTVSAVCCLAACT